MGVKTLNTFIHRYPIRLLHDIDLHHATLIIDGSELFYHLYFDQDNGRRGGEYSEFRNIINEFFDTLVDRCNIRCCVVCDRFKSESNITRYLESRTEKLQSMTSIVNGHTVENGVRAQPLLGKDVFMQTLEELSIPYIVVSGDGDAELAAIANRMDGYVLAADTDFCVFDLSKGFLPLQDFQWRNAKEKCPCKIFHRRNLEQIFRIPPQAVAFLEALLSHQDGLQQVDFTPFFRDLSTVVRIPRNLRPIRFRRRPDPLENLLIWLGSQYRNDGDAIGCIRKIIPDLPVDDFKNCLDVYRSPPDVSILVDDLHQGGHSFGALTSCFVGVGESLSRADFLPIVPDDQDKPSANKMSASIRYATYQIGITQERNRDPDDTQVLVTDRRGLEYAADVVTVAVDDGVLEPLHVDLNGDELLRRDDMQEIMESREKFILDVLSRGENHGSIDAFNNETKLLAAIFKYWATSTKDDERQVDEAVKALAFTLSSTYHECDLMAEMTEISESTFDKAALHSSSQWLCCVKDATILNVVLGKPLECIVVGRLFSGTLYQRAFSYFVGCDDIDGQSERTFAGDGDALFFYKQLIQLGSE